MKYSVDQERIFDFVKNDKRNGRVQAVAGSGKTTTIKEAIRRLGPLADVLFVAFNKHIVDSIKLDCDVCTMNSLGYRMIREHLGYKKVVKDKVFNILKFDVLKKDWARVKLFKDVPRVVSLLKANVLPVEAYKELAAHHGIELPLGFKEILDEVWDLDTDSKVIDFDDQIYIPVDHGWDTKLYDIVFVDEAQDLNPVMLQLIYNIAKRVIFVGDDRQAIYGFRGADSRAMDTIAEKFSTVDLPLYTCYRCSSAVIKEAQKIVPYITFGGTLTGSVCVVHECNPGAADLVLCRTTAPLITSCLALLSRGIEATIQGRDFGVALKELAADIGDRDIYEYATEKSKHMKYDARVAFMDRIDSLAVLPQLSDIDKLFRGKGVLHSTIHRAKGAEHDTVYILRPDLIPHPLAAKDWQREQEQNLKYVAITRARENLYYVTG